MLINIFLGALFAQSVTGSASAATSRRDEPSLNPNDYRSSSVIYRDVVVIGGGASGTYTAVRLKDSGKSVIVIEKKETLGGMAETYTATNGQPINYGVRYFNQVPTVQRYLQRFNISFELGYPSPPIKFVDFATGLPVNFSMPNAQNQGAAFRRYMAELSKYPELRLGFDLKHPIAEDLLLSYADFAKKYNVTDMVYSTFLHQGIVPWLEAPMLYMFKYVNSYLLEAMSKGYVIPKGNGLQELYTSAHDFLAKDGDVFTGSTPTAMDRSSDSSSVKVAVQTPNGIKLVIARKLVSAITPTLQVLQHYDLTAEERHLFSKWTMSGYYAGILKNTGLNDSMNYMYAQPEQPLQIPQLPGAYMYGTTGVAGLTQVIYESPTVESEEAIKQSIQKELNRLQNGLGLQQTVTDWAAFASHSPFNTQVSRDDIKGGFYSQLSVLNGQSNTFYNSATFQGWSSTELWEFTEEYLLPRILKSLD